MREVTLKQREQARIQVLNTVLEHHLPIAQAAEIMGISERHTKRLLAAYCRDGPAAVAHGNRGRRPHNAVPEAAATAVEALGREVQALVRERNAARTGINWRFKTRDARSKLHRLYPFDSKVD